MAGHSKFKNIQHRKNAQDQKRAKVFTKLTREIITAAKIGMPDPASNPRLRNAISTARSYNLPRERIEKALKQAADPGSSENYFEMRYEGFGPSGIAFIIEALTDNKNRAAAEIRAALSKFGGNLGETGSASFMFNHLGIILYPIAIDKDEIFEAATDSGALDIDSDDEQHIIYTSVENFNEVVSFLTNKYGEPLESYLGWQPQNIIEITEQEQIDKLTRLIDVLEDNDDVQRVYTNTNI